MARVVGHMPEGLSDIQKAQRQLAVFDDSLVQQAKLYRLWEAKLFSCYKRYIAHHEIEVVCLMDRYEGKLVFVYEEIMRLLEEREKLCLQIEKMHSVFQAKALDICDSIMKDEVSARLDQIWIDKTRRKLLEQKRVKVEEECRTRAWCLDDVQRWLEEASAVAYARYDTDSEANKKYVGQYMVNLIGFAIRLGKFPEDATKMMREHQQRESELIVKLAINYRSMEKERREQEQVMFDSAMAGQNICKWVDEHIRRCGYWCQEREKLYYQIHDKQKRFTTLGKTVETLLNALYAGRSNFIVKQFESVKNIVLRAKQERELTHPRNVLLLTRPSFPKNIK